jgi:hypothetical protein
MTFSTVRGRGLVLILGLFLAQSIGAETDGRHELLPGRPCDPELHYHAAREALSQGDRAVALEHLKQAREILARCPQPTAPSPESLREGEAKETASRLPGEQGLQLDS